MNEVPPRPMSGHEPLRSLSQDEHLSSEALCTCFLTPRLPLRVLVCFVSVIMLRTRMIQLLRAQGSEELCRCRRIILFNHVPHRPAEIYTPLSPPNSQVEGLRYNSLPIVQTHPLIPPVVVWQECIAISILLFYFKRQSQQVRKKTIHDRLVASGLKPCALKIDWEVICYWAMHFDKRADMGSMFHFKMFSYFSSMHV
jgi:hypothetical protein